MSGIVDQMKNMSPKERSERARNAALAGAKKRKMSAEPEYDFEFEIKSGVPLPDHARRKKQYPFLESLPIGKYVEVKDKAVFQRLYSAAGNYGKKTGKTFAGRTLKDGFGIWRVK